MRAGVRSFVWILAVCALGIAVAPRTARAQDSTTVVHVVLFSSPTCSFCREIVEQELPPIREQFGLQMELFYVDVDTAEGGVLYERFVDTYGVSGAPLVLVDDTVLGGINIPKRLPDLVRDLLDAGGTDWPNLPGLQEYMESIESEAEQTPIGEVKILSSSEAPASSSGLPQGVAPSGVVRAILFFSPVCGHCHIVMTEDLPPLLDKYGSKLEILAVDITTEVGHTAFVLVIEHFQLEYAGVPFLLVGDGYLMGGGDIPEQFPGLIDRHLAQGGLDWPEIPGLWEALGLVGLPTAPTIQPSEAPFSAVQFETATAEPDKSWIEQVQTNIQRDPGGNALSILVLAGMLVTLMAAVLTVLRGAAVPADHKPVWLLPMLCVVGLGVAGYLAFVEVSNTEAVCGPVGDCNTVQQSAYARLFGILPIGVMGIAGYIAILAVRMGGLILKGRWLTLSDFGIFAMGVFGFLFSIYLTFLEPFVIGASCAWCLTSAVLMTVIFWLSLKPGLSAWRSLAPMLAGFKKG